MGQYRVGTSYGVSPFDGAVGAQDGQRTVMPILLGNNMMQAYLGYYLDKDYVRHAVTGLRDQDSPQGIAWQNYALCGVTVYDGLGNSLSTAIRDVTCLSCFINITRYGP